MKKDEKLSRWLLFGLLGIPLPLIIYFYLWLHIGYGVPLRDVAFPAAMFCVFAPAFAAAAHWGTRARARGNSFLLFFVVGLFALFCGFEFCYFENRLSPTPEGFSNYGFTVVWAVVITVGGYFIDKWIRPRNGGNAKTPGKKGTA